MLHCEVVHKLGRVVVFCSLMQMAVALFITNLSDIMHMHACNCVVTFSNRRGRCFGSVGKTEKCIAMLVNQRLQLQRWCTLDMPYVETSLYTTR